MMNRNDLNRIISEELTKQDVNGIVSDKLNSYMRKSEIDKRVKEIVADVMERFFKMMYNKRGFWKGEVKNG